MKIFSRKINPRSNWNFWY